MVGIATGNPGRINPDLVAQARDVEAGELSAVQPARPQRAAPAPGGRRSLLDEQDPLPGLAQLVGHGDAARAAADDDIVVRGVSGDGHGGDGGGGRGGGAGAGDGLGGLSGPGGVGRVGGVTVELGADDALAVVVLADLDRVRALGAVGGGEGLGPSQDQRAAARGRAPGLATHGPAKTVFTSEDHRVVGVVDGGSYLRQLRVAGVDGRQIVAGCVAKGSQDLPVVGISEKEERIRHRAAEGHATPACSGCILGGALLRKGREKQEVSFSVSNQECFFPKTFTPLVRRSYQITDKLGGIGLQATLGQCYAES